MSKSNSNAKGFGFSGFTIQAKPAEASKLIGPPASSRGRSHKTFSNIGKRRAHDDEEYFEHDDVDRSTNLEDLEYLPAPGSPVLNQKSDTIGDDDEKSEDEESEEDPLDQFMAGIEKEVKEVEKKEKKKGHRDDIDLEDNEESYYRYMEENPLAGTLPDEEDFIDYDEDGNAILPDKKVIDPLPPIDHSEIKYEEFSKNFYIEHDEIKNISDSKVTDLREKLGLRVSGIMAPKPVSSFAHFNFDEALIKIIRKQGFTMPTPIQAQGVPVALSGRDIIGIAKTGSGKTAAYLWPLMVHIVDQHELLPGDGPIGLIVAPTRELSQQIYHEAKKVGKAFGINVICTYGGGSLYEQGKACEEGAEIIVATPGRLIELVKKNSTNLKRVTYLVFDEADRMFDMGFEPQVRSIADHVRPDRQTLMFSATFRKKVERIARHILADPIRIVQGDVGEANEDITQIVKVMPNDSSKYDWLTANIVQFCTVGGVLIFVTRKHNSEELCKNLKLRDFSVGLIHGDLNQVERNEVITAFKNKAIPILVATDVAARGLDIAHVRTVINYDVARDIDTHTHRIGRTGRAGHKGTAVTLISKSDKEFAGHLVRNLESASQIVPRELLELAMQNNWFKKNRFQQKEAKNIGGAGLGFKKNRKSAGGSEDYTTTIISQTKPHGPQSDRLTAMKSAFQNQFKNQFISAASSTVVDNSNWTGSGTFSSLDNAPPSKPTLNPDISLKKKSRWE